MGYNENEIWTGKYWAGGKKIYKKTLPNLNVSLIVNQWVNVAAASLFPDIEAPLYAMARNTANDKQTLIFTQSRVKDGYISLETFMGGNRVINELTLEYIKTS